MLQLVPSHKFHSVSLYSQLLQAVLRQVHQMTQNDIEH